MVREKRASTLLPEPKIKVSHDLLLTLLILKAEREGE